MCIKDHTDKYSSMQQAFWPQFLLLSASIWKPQYTSFFLRKKINTHILATATALIYAHESQLIARQQVFHLCNDEEQDTYDGEDMHTRGFGVTFTSIISLYNNFMIVSV